MNALASCGERFGGNFDRLADDNHPYAEPHRAGAQVATDRQVANRAPDLSGTPEKKGVGPT